MFVEAILRDATAGNDGSRKLGVQATGPVRDGRHVAVVQDRVCKEIQDLPVDRATLALHQVVDQAVPPWLIEVQEPTGDIEAQPHERLAALLLQQRVGVVQHRVEGVDGMPGVAPWR